MYCICESNSVELQLNLFIIIIIVIIIIIIFFDVLQKYTASSLVLVLVFCIQAEPYIGITVDEVHLILNSWCDELSRVNVIFCGSISSQRHLFF